MALLEKWNPSREIERFRREFDDLLEKVGFERGGSFLKDWDSMALKPALESFVDGDKFTVRIELAGIDPKNVDIKVADGVLTVKGSREQKIETESKKRDFFRREIRYGTFERSVSLPEGMKAEDLKAIYHDGILELSGPMPKESAPKEIKIEIQHSEPKQE
ncbi:MAG TPA: Hsp20/alpha crystallin family protein [Candidatus Binataceae bacterium]|nr:Hsp20/alpha crystallin family protein [Candidatus Binataceae bacterium]